jgi:hypothetical protein
VVKIIERYLNHRRALPLLDEENPANDWTHLTEEEKKNREEAKVKSTDEKALAKVEEEKKSEAALAGLDPLGKIQFANDKEFEGYIT